MAQRRYLSCLVFQNFLITLFLQIKEYLANPEAFAVAAPAPAEAAPAAKAEEKVEEKDDDGSDSDEGGFVNNISSSVRPGKLIFFSYRVVCSTKPSELFRWHLCSLYKNDHTRFLTVPKALVRVLRVHECSSSMACELSFRRPRFVRIRRPTPEPMTEDMMPDDTVPLSSLPSDLIVVHEALYTFVVQERALIHPIIATEFLSAKYI
jgi:hypothetical protein